jgi:hypothetical protein
MSSCRGLILVLFCLVVCILVHPMVNQVFFNLTFFYPRPRRSLEFTFYFVVVVVVVVLVGIEVSQIKAF